MAKNFQVSSKLNDGRIFVVAADSFADFKTNLTEILGTFGAETLLTTMGASIDIIASTPTTTAQAVANLNTLGATAVTAGPPQTYTASTAPTNHFCHHGTMSRREGTSAKGPWKAYMCPSPKGTPDQCPPTFIRRNEPEWATF